jgi:hypothetical protein
LVPKDSKKPAAERRRKTIRGASGGSAANTNGVWIVQLVTSS